MSKHVVVIGGGVIGLCSAYYLAKAGHKATVLERGGVHHDCCSLGNSGIIVPSHFEPLAAPGMVGYGMRMMLRRNSPFGMKVSLNPELVSWGLKFARSCTRENVERGSRLLRDLHMGSRELYWELDKASNQAFGLESGGLIMLCATDKALASEAKLAEHASKLDLQTRVLNRQEVTDIEPNTEVRAAGAVHFLDDCRLDPPKLIAWLTEEAQRLGVEVKYGAQVDSAVLENGKVKAIRTTKGDVEADEFVVAAGAWSGQVAKSLGFRMPMQGGKGYSSDLPTTTPPKHAYILVEARVAVTPMANRVRFGGTMEIVGDDLSVNPRRYQGILESIPRYLPSYQPQDFQGVGVWAGLRPCSADGLPYLGRPKQLSNAIVATGHSMMGVSLGAVTGQIVANLASEQPPGYDLSALAPDRFN